MTASNSKEFTQYIVNGDHGASGYFTPIRSLSAKRPRSSIDTKQIDELYGLLLQQISRVSYVAFC